MLYIRTDMNKTIATGHVMRCLAIADAARDLEEETCFILADEKAVKVLEERGYGYIILNTLWNDMNAELPLLEKVVRERQIESILIDSYQVTENYLKRLSEIVQITYLDDLNAFDYPVNSIICYANYWEKFQYTRKYKEKKLFLGTAYVPLRKEFSNNKKKKISPQVENLLLLSGGTDFYDVLEQVLYCLDKKNYQRIDVICGRYYTKYETLMKKYSLYKNIHIYKAVANIQDFMKKADLAVSAGGTTLYELCAMGTPTISYSFVDNQLENVKKFQEDKIIDYAGDVRYDDITKKINEYLIIYHTDYKLREERAGKMQELVDGKGAMRIAELLKEGKD